MAFTNMKKTQMLDISFSPSIPFRHHERRQHPRHGRQVRGERGALPPRRPRLRRGQDVRPPETRARTLQDRKVPRADPQDQVFQPEVDEERTKQRSNFSLIKSTF